MPTPDQRIAALVAAVNASDVAQGRPRWIADRTANDIGARCHDIDLVSADLDGDGKQHTFIVLTTDEAVTSKRLGATLGRDIDDTDIYGSDGIDWLVIPL
jgi:hypothetical protein